MIEKDVIIIGGGPAGLAAAVKLYDQGVDNILILERERHLGGILRQCIHDGFGLTRFGETLSGPEYAQRYIDDVKSRGIPYLTDVTVTDLTSDRRVTAVCRQGLLQYRARAVVLAMGCRERTRSAISIPGTRPSGVYTAGVAQAYINLFNIMPGREVVILGSGDIGMIMARRLTLEGAHVQAVLEIQPYPSGLPRNVEQCLYDYGIPLYLRQTIVDIQGTSRLEGIVVAQVDEKYRPIAGTETRYACDTLILSVGLIPENELSLAAGVHLDPGTKGAMVDDNYQTTVEGIFAAGNVLQVHDLVDFVSQEGERLAISVSEYLARSTKASSPIELHTGAGISYLVPRRVSGEKDFILSMRVKAPGKDREIRILQDGTPVAVKKMRKVLPAEMIQIPVSREMLRKDAKLEVCLI